MYTPQIRVQRPRPGRCRPRHWAPKQGGDFLLVGLAVDVLVRYAPFHGLHPVCSYKPAKFRGQPLVVWGRPEKSMKRRCSKPSDPAGGPTHLAPVETNLLGMFGNIIAHLTEVRYDDGAPRRPGWLLLKTQGSTWSCFIKEPDAAAQMNVNAQTLDDLLILADMLLGADDAPWEPDPNARPQNGKKSR